MQVSWWWSKSETCRSETYVYFNVNCNVFFKLIKVHLLVSELYTHYGQLSSFISPMILTSFASSLEVNYTVLCYRRKNNSILYSYSTLSMFEVPYLSWSPFWYSCFDLPWLILTNRDETEWQEFPSATVLLLSRSLSAQSISVFHSLRLCAFHSLPQTFSVFFDSGKYLHII